MQNLIDEKALKKWQDKFCNATNVYAYCIDSGGHPITEMSGKDTETEQIKQVISKEMFLNIFKRVTEGGLEEQAVETTAVPNLRLAAISIMLDGKVVAVWIVCGILTDSDESGYEYEPFHGFEYAVTEKEFYYALDLLRDTTYSLLKVRFSMLDAEAESRRSRYSENEMSALQKRNEAITDVVQLLESDNSIEAIMTDVLRILGTYLDISTAVLCRVHEDGALMDIAAEWCNKGIISNFDKTKDLPCGEILKTDKVLVLSSGTICNEEERGKMQMFGTKALIVIPIAISGTISLYACFGENIKERQWRVEDVKFLNDATKILQSVITKRAHKNTLDSSYASLEMILDNVGSSVYVRDMQTGEVLFANRSMRNNFSKEIKNNTLDSLFEKDLIKGNRRGKQEVYHEERERWYDLYYTHITWVDGRPVTLFAIYDITEKRVYKQKIEQQAYTDFLTGLYNRLCCEKDLARHIDEAKKSGSKGALLYLDLDDFKHINDGLGHQYGDVLLKAISHSLQRVEEIENSCYRVGGDEFIIIIPPKSRGKFDQIISDIKQIFSKPWFLKDADYYCTMSMGVVDFPEEGESVHKLIKKADIAMYEAKKLGKNRVAMYSDNIDSASNRRLDMEKNMRDAAVSGYKEFEVYFQPIMDIQLPGTPCTGAEALIRWNSEELGFITPAEFIPLAEYLGLINPIGNHVLRKSCFYCKQWNDNGHPNYKVNVNLSVVQLLQTDIVEIVAQTLKDTGLNPRNLTLEVTESLAINDMERMKSILAKIKKLGVRIALDDFGTGYSSLNHIREIPFDVIKVDQSFVKDLAGDAYSQSFIRMVAELADAIDVSICVEGIETKEQYKVLEGMKVRLVQGYYFDKPISKEEFEKKYVNAGK
ncbi:MAG: EAL domain-containing protein [Clostridiales bacterium]|nr:EAL domain-containing protein [Clostridiales bacterium]